MRSCLPLLLAALIGAALPSAAWCDAPPLPASAAAFSAPWNPQTQGRFVTALCRDAQGSVWVGSEDNGVWRYSPAAKTWTQFHGPDDLGDAHCLALCADKKGRVWCGTAAHGVSVFDGSAWRHFGPANGPLGAHVTALAVSPLTGDVWGATEAGLFRYALASDTWGLVTLDDGLPSDAASALAFGRDGTLYAGTDSDGIAIGSAADDYHAWRTVPGPAAPPAALAGDGLPSALVCCLLVGSDGAAYCGTAHGLAVSHDGGATWRYRRAGSQPGLLGEDYVSALAEDADEHLWVGHQQEPPDVFDTKIGRALPLPDALEGAGDWVTALLPTANGMLVGGYGGGLLSAPASEELAPSAPLSAPLPGLPLPAPAPSLAQLNSLLAEVGAVPPEAHADLPFVAALDQDWQTKGDWLGRYGRYWACLCALFHPIAMDYIWGASPKPVDYDLSAGQGQGRGDSMRYWLDARYTDNPNSLELPPTYLHSRILKGYTTWAVNRRQCEVNDQGADPSRPQSGPNVYATVAVPEGLYALSLYDYNKDGHTGDNRRRDYRVSVRAHVGQGVWGAGQFDAQPELAHSRIHAFWNGVWTRFLVRGPQTLTVELNRGDSFNTTLMSVTLDRIDDNPLSVFHTEDEWQALSQAHGQQRQSLLAETPSAHAKRFAPAASEAEAADKLFDALTAAALLKPRWAATGGRRAYLLLMRWYAAHLSAAPGLPDKQIAARLAACAFQAGQYAQGEDAERAAGMTPPRDTEHALRWDGVAISNSGMESQVLADFLAHGQTKSDVKP